jgi:hypothetical protein
MGAMNTEEASIIRKLDNICKQIEEKVIDSPPEKGESEYWWLNRVGLDEYFEGT